MTSGRFLRLFHTLEYPVYKRLKIFKGHLPTTRSLHKYSFTTQYPIFVRHISNMYKKIYKLTTCEAIR